MNIIYPDINRLKEFLVQPWNVVILSHRNPDGDALGSTLALSLFLQKHTQSTKVIYPSEYPVVFEWMPGASDALIYDMDKEESTRYINNADIIYCLDFNALDRIDKMGELVAGLKNTPIVMIDHHIDPEPFADEMYSDHEASSTAEMVFSYIEMLGKKAMIDKDIASCLYTGIITDTGQFHHQLSPKLMEITAQLLSYEIEYQWIVDQVMHTSSEKQLRILGDVLANKMEVLPRLGAAIVYLTKEDYKKYSISRGDTEGIVNYPLMIPGVKVSAFIHEQPTIIKLSLRSKGDISVQQLARDHFNGGGHKNASGGAVYGTLEKTIEKFKRVIPYYL